MLSVILSLALAIIFIIELISRLTVVAIAAVLLFAYATKPTNESFKAFLKHELNKRTQSRILTYLVTKTFDKEIKDYVIFKTATINNIYDPDREKDEILFIGIFQTWRRL